MRISGILAVLIGAALFVAATAGSAQAQSSCAVGGFVTNKSKGTLQQLLAFTTNGTFFITYAGAVTTGTSGCSSSGIVNRDVEQELFAAASYDGLLQDMSAGGGSYLSAFAELMGCDGALRVEFAQWSQANAERLSAAPESPKAWVDSVRSGLAAHPSLSGCTRLT